MPGLDLHLETTAVEAIALAAGDGADSAAAERYESNAHYSVLSGATEELEVQPPDEDIDIGPTSEPVPEAIAYAASLTTRAGTEEAAAEPATTAAEPADKTEVRENNGDQRPAESDGPKKAADADTRNARQQAEATVVADVQSPPIREVPTDDAVTEETADKEAARTDSTKPGTVMLRTDADGSTTVMHCGTIEAYQAKVAEAERIEERTHDRNPFTAAIARIQFKLCGHQSFLAAHRDPNIHVMW